jgi:hypothetical protein
MKIQVKKISVPYFTSLIKRMLLMDTSLYINIDGERIWSDVYTPTKDVVKSVSLPIADVMQFDKPLKETIKLSFFSGQRLLTCLGYFDPHNLSAELNVFKDEDDGILYAEKIILKDNQLKIELHCQDISLGFTSMTPDQVKRAFDKAKKTFEFKLSSESFSKIQNLQTLDKSELFGIYQDGEGVHIKSDSFDIVIDDNVKNAKSEDKYSIFKSFLQRVDKETYTVTVCENKMILTSDESSTQIALNLAITE